MKFLRYITLFFVMLPASLYAWSEWPVDYSYRAQEADFVGIIETHEVQETHIGPLNKLLFLYQGKFKVITTIKPHGRNTCTSIESWSSVGPTTLDSLEEGRYLAFLDYNPVKKCYFPHETRSLIKIDEAKNTLHWHIARSGKNSTEEIEVAKAVEELRTHLGIPENTAGRDDQKVDYDEMAQRANFLGIVEISNVSKTETGSFNRLVNVYQADCRISSSMKSEFKHAKAKLETWSGRINKYPVGLAELKAGKYFAFLDWDYQNKCYVPYNENSLLKMNDKDLVTWNQIVDGKLVDEEIKATDLMKKLRETLAKPVAPQHSDDEIICP